MLIPRLLFSLPLLASAVLADGTGDTAAAAASGSNSGCLMYTIQGNDTGYDIAKRFGLEFSVMNASNPNIAWDKIKIGENVLIPSGYTTQPATGVTPAPSCPPAAPAAPIAESGTAAVAAEPRDASGSAASAPPASSATASGSGGAAPPAGSASSAAAPAGSSASAAGTAAPAASGSASAAPATSGCKAYIVMSGDTGETIAQKNGATMVELNAQNPSIVWEKLEVDQILVLPPTATGTGLLDRPDCKPAGIVPPAPPVAAAGAASGAAGGPGTAAAPPAPSAAASGGAAADGAAGGSGTAAAGGAPPPAGSTASGSAGAGAGAAGASGGAPPAGSTGAAGGAGGAASGASTTASSAPAAPSAAGSSGGTAAPATTGAPSTGSAKAVAGTSSGGGGGAEPVSVIKYIWPTSTDCASAKDFKDECATAAEAAPHIVAAFAQYKVTEPGEQAALLSWMLFESAGFKYNRNHYPPPGNPGQGTRCMFMPEFVKEYAASIPALNSGSVSDPDAILKLVQPNEYSFASAAWFYSTKCDDKTKAGLKAGTNDGWKAWLKDCVQTEVGEPGPEGRQELYDKARKALGVTVA